MWCPKGPTATFWPHSIYVFSYSHFQPFFTPCLDISLYISNGNSQQAMKRMLSYIFFLNKGRVVIKTKPYKPHNKYNKPFSASQCVTVQYSIWMYRNPNTACIQRFECERGTLLTRSKRKHGRLLIWAVHIVEGLHCYVTNKPHLAVQFNRHRSWRSDVIEREKTQCWKSEKVKVKKRSTSTQR